MSLLFLQTLVDPNVNVPIVLPEVLLSITGIILMLIESYMPNRHRVTGMISIIGLVAAGAALFYLWSTPDAPRSAFNGMIVTDGLRLSFSLVFLLRMGRIPCNLPPTPLFGLAGKLVEWIDFQAPRFHQQGFRPWTQVRPSPHDGRFHSFTSITLVIISWLAHIEGIEHDLCQIFNFHTSNLQHAPFQEGAASRILRNRGTHASSSGRL